MSKKQFVSEIVNTPEGVLAWPVVFEPETKTGEDGKKRTIYRGDIIFEANAPLDPLRNLARAACEAEWGPDDIRWPPFRTRAVRETSEKNPNPQTMKPWEGYEHGKYFISCQSQYKPSIIDISGREIIDPAELYGGCKVVFAVNAYTYQYKGYGVKFGLVAILKVAEGKPFGAARPDASALFKPMLKPGATPGGAVAAPAPATGVPPPRRML